MKKQVKLIGTEGTNTNQFAQIISETDKFYHVSLQDKLTLERHTRAFSKRTLKCVSNTSEFTKNLRISSL